MAARTGLLVAIFVLLTGWPAHADNQDAVPNTPPVLLQMIRDTAIHDELQLDTTQRERIITALKPIDARWFRARNFPSDKQREEISLLTASLRRSMTSILNASQQERLTQLERQALGTRMLTRPDVAQALRLSPATQKVFNDAFVDTDRKSIEYQQQSRKGELDAAEAQQKIAKLKKAEQSLLAKQLTDQQRSAIGKLTGTPFDFSKITRSLPLAPELTGQGVTWIQGGPLKLSDLRGKVVAVHYYAFQCINCQRNLPHYAAWHKDYADQGLVVIGIQTPETSAERKLDRVASAAKGEGIEYPVMLDADKENWNAWSTTMWPTVYLIDKQGFLRRWWQGEMNWQGTQGEKQMRATIEQLLAEE